MKHLGDCGMNSVFGQQCTKDSDIVHFLGDVDELIAWIHALLLQVKDKTYLFKLYAMLRITESNSMIIDSFGKGD
jgi:cob(I)alamin adenosyltransferase